MRTTNTEQGFAHVMGLAVVVVVLAIIGFAGYKVMQSQKSNTPAAPTATTAETAATQKKIDAQPTLKSVDQTLSEATTALNSGFSTTTLDSDIQALY